MSLITPDFGLLFWMTLIFLILFFILAKFGFPMITGMVEKRADRISESIAKAQEAEEKLASLEKEHEALIKDAREKQALILKEASQTRNEILAQAREQAKTETEKIVEKAREDIRVEKQAAMNDARKQIAMLSVGMAGKILRQELQNEDSQQALLDKLLGEVPENNSLEH